MTARTGIASWSGGKDSCLACYRAMKSGIDIRYLLTFISKEYRRSCFHGVTDHVLRLQAACVGIPLAIREVDADMKRYEDEFTLAVSELAAKGAGAMVFGDVYLDEHRQWVERVTGSIGIEPIEPLWGVRPEAVVEEFIAAGFEAVVVSCRADLFGKETVGRPFDRSFVRELTHRHICPCGENGEFHTFVLNGPIFKKALSIDLSAVVLREGFAKYWFLDMQRVVTVDKTYLSIS